MSDICELWNLPWHALQKKLAYGKGMDAAAYPTVALRSVNMQIGTVGADSWLGRARLRTALAFQVRQ
jgi:hypothetical protein